MKKKPASKKEKADKAIRRYESVKANLFPSDRPKEYVARLEDLMTTLPDYALGHLVLSQERFLPTTESALYAVADGMFKGESFDPLQVVRAMGELTEVTSSNAREFGINPLDAPERHALAKELERRMNE